MIYPEFLVTMLGNCSLRYSTNYVHRDLGVTISRVIRVPRKYTSKVARFETNISKCPAVISIRWSIRVTRHEFAHQLRFESFQRYRKTCSG
jgi:hypothetical protein